MPQPIYAIDPGTAQSASVCWDGDVLLSHAIVPNDTLLEFLRNDLFISRCHFVVEMIASYGMPVGKEVFETVLMIGRILEIAHSRDIECTLVYRRDVKLHICKSPKAKDGNIRQALIDRFGAPGTKKAQGKTYGLSADKWQAFALAVTAFDTFTTSAERAAS